jgi:hypothetical protein
MKSLHVSPVASEAHIRLRQAICYGGRRFESGFLQQRGHVEKLLDSNRRATSRDVDQNCKGASGISFPIGHFCGTPGSTAATPSGLMLNARNVNGSLPGLPH